MLRRFGGERLQHQLPYVARYLPFTTDWSGSISVLCPWRGIDSRSSGQKRAVRILKSATQSGHWPPSSLRSDYENRVECTFIEGLR
jgi:hypothetical protein